MNMLTKPRAQTVRGIFGRGTVGEVMNDLGSYNRHFQYRRTALGSFGLGKDAPERHCRQAARFIRSWHWADQLRPSVTSPATVLAAPIRGWPL